MDARRGLLQKGRLTTWIDRHYTAWEIFMGFVSLVYLAMAVVSERVSAQSASTTAVSYQRDLRGRVRLIRKQGRDTACNAANSADARVEVDYNIKYSLRWCTVPKYLLSRTSFVVAATLLIAVMSLTVTYASPAVQYIRSYGSGNGRESGPGQLATPYGVAIEPMSGNVVVADSMNDRLEVFRDGGELIKSFGKTGSKHGRFRTPDGLGVNRKGGIYVADEGNHRVQEFSPSFKFMRQFGSFTNGPTDLAVGPSGDVYAADSAFILHFTGSGSYVGRFGGTGTGPGQFNSTVTGLAVGPKGNVWAGDYSGGRVEKFTASGSYLLSFGASGKGAVEGAIGVAATKSAIFVSDNGHERIVEFNPYGKFIQALGTRGKGKLDNTGLLAVDCHGNLYDSDFDIGRIREYGNPGSPNGVCTK